MTWEELPVMKRLLLPFLLILLLGGCTSYNSPVSVDPRLAAMDHLFVLANASDSHGLEHHITAALRARGRTAESGPRTMMPEGTQAVVTYQDSWTWDFGDRLVYLQIIVRDVKSQQILASLQFQAKIPGRQSAAQIVDELVGRIGPLAHP